MDKKKASKFRKYLLKYITEYKQPSNSKLLEIGCGKGRFGLIMGNSFLQYTGIDPNEERIDIANKNNSNKKIKYIVGKAEKIPLKTKFDIIFYSYSWHYIKDFKKAFLEIKRVLKKDGIILILEPTKTPENWKSPILNKDSPLFSKKAYEKKVSKLIIAEKEIKKNKNFNIIKYHSGKHNIYIIKIKK